MNTYRLLRAQVGDESLERFVGDDSDPRGDYAAVLLLLAAVVGHPVGGERMLSCLGETADGDDVWGAIEALAPLLPEDAATFRHWAPQVGRFSFGSLR